MSISAMLPALSLLACSGGEDETPYSEPSPVEIIEGGTDADGDGYDESIDCDEVDPDVHPGVDEICDGVDNDCDGFVDDEDEGLSDGSWYFEDNDGDGWGAEGSGGLFCEPPKGSLSYSGDCDDDDVDINPDAIDVCDDGIDNDCDGTDLGCEATTGSAEVLFTGETGGDEAGKSVGTGADLDGDGFNEILIGARGNDDTANNAGAAYLVYGPVTEGEAPLVDAVVKLVGDEADARAGRTVAFVGDVDDDGVDDLAVAAPVSSEQETLGGTTYVVSGSGLSSGSLSGAAYHTIYGASAYDYAGTGLLAAGDVNGDAIDDLWVGAVGDDSAATSSGAVFLLLGPLSGGTSDLIDAHAELNGEGKLREVGTVLDSGDFNGDGLADVAVGDAQDDLGGGSAGSAYVVAGPVSGVLGLASGDAHITGVTGESLGYSLANAGDTDGDGYDDLMIGAPDNGNGGALAGIVYVVPGSKSLSELSGTADAVASATIVGQSSEDRAGSAVDGAGDFDDDGELDFIVGASSYGVSGQGAGYLVLGPLSGTLNLANADARFAGEHIDDQIGDTVAFTGPVADKSPDGILLATPFLDLAGADSGGAYLIVDLGG